MSTPPSTSDTQGRLLNIGTRDKSVGWYTKALGNVSEAECDLLENYSHLAPAKVIPHILEVSYDKIIASIQSGALLLDLGYCCGQDLREAKHDGAPSKNLYGADLMSEFIPLGYDLFLDKDTSGAHFIQADIFEEGGALKELDGKLDFVQISLFLHIWDLERQTIACQRIVKLLKQEKGAMAIGQQIGATQPARWALTANGSTMYKHNVESSEMMWQEVGKRTGTEWKATALLDRGLGMDQNKRFWDHADTRRLVFDVVRV